MIGYLKAEIGEWTVPAYCGEKGIESAEGIGDSVKIEANARPRVPLK